MPNKYSRFGLVAQHGGGGGGAAAPDTAAAAAAVSGGAAPPAATAPGVLDMHDFTTWGPDTWGLLLLDELKFPTDPNMSICSVRSYLAIAMILWYQDDLRLKHMQLWPSWGELKYAWSATFHCDLHPNGLEKWPKSEPHAFTESESRWLDGTLRFLKKITARNASGRFSGNVTSCYFTQEKRSRPRTAFQWRSCNAFSGSNQDSALQDQGSRCSKAVRSEPDWWLRWTCECYLFQCLLGRCA